MTWWRAYHGLPYDAKLGIIARRLQARRTDVISVWLALLDFASQSQPRGSVSAVQPLQVAFGLDMDADEVSRIIAEFATHGMIQDGRLFAWDKRQRQWDCSTSRVHRFRDRVKRTETVSETLETVSPDTETVSPNIRPFGSNGTVSGDPLKTLESGETVSKRVSPFLKHNPSVSVSVSSSTTVFSTTTQSNRFNEFIDSYPVKEGINIAYGVWSTLVTTENEKEVFACLARYKASERAERSPKNPANWLHDCSRDGWKCDWPAKNGKPKTPSPIMKTKPSDRDPAR